MDTERVIQYAELRTSGAVQSGLIGHDYVQAAKRNQLPLWKRFDPALVIIITLFVAFEIVAHFHYHNANGWYTLSNRIVTNERKYGWPARVVVYGGLIVLAIHLWGGVF